MRPQFGHGRRLERLHPLFEAVDKFLFSPETPTAGAPHIRDPLDLKRYMSMVIVAMLPCTLASVYFFGLRVLLIILLSYAVGGAVEVLFAIIRKEPINEGFLVTGLVFPLILPPGLPLWMVAAGIAFGVIIGKELFGGTGRNLYNPALVGRCFLFLGYPVALSSGWVVPGTGLTGRLLHYVDASKIDAITKATPLGLAKQGTWESISHLFLGNVAGSIGETSGLAILAGGLFLCLTKVANWRTVAGILLGTVLLQSALHQTMPTSTGSALWHIGAGGLLFGAFFMATDPVTSPATNVGKWIYGFLIGVVTILIRNFSGYVEGMMFAILFGNTIAPLIDQVVYSQQLRTLSYEK
jgi:Na+-transporting NADH:ubiquinone oxidoreductase subunit B/electron transport complex protein RnfD